MNNNYCIRKLVKEHEEMFRKMSEDECLQQQILNVSTVVSRTLLKGGRLLLCGNGGSASDAQHIAAEFVGRFQKERMAYDAEALTVNLSTITSIANDYDYSVVYARQIEAKGREGDVLIGISTSGKSINVLKALKSAKKKNMITIMLMGDFESTDIENICDYVLKMPSKKTARIQEGHMFVGHIISELVENELLQRI